MERFCAYGSEIENHIPVSGNKRGANGANQISIGTQVYRRHSADSKSLTNNRVF
jgi:hypothetical protein